MPSPAPPLSQTAAVVALVLVSILAVPADATMGLVGGLGRATTKDSVAHSFDGWDAGLVAMAPDQRSFWRFTYGRARGDRVPLVFSSAEGRLTFCLAGKGAAWPDTGAGGGLGWLKQDGKVVRTTLWSGFAGLIIVPDRAVSWIWRDFPCWTCIFRRTTVGCRYCLIQRENRRATAANTTPPIIIGAEAGYRKAGLSLEGPEYRAWLAFLF